MRTRVRDGDIRPKVPMRKTLPRIETTRNGLLRVPRNIWILVGLVILGLGAGGSALSIQTRKPVVVTSETVNAGPEKKPEFKAATPVEAETTPEIKYDAEKKVVNFVDKIDGVSITVSQQQLPEGFKANPAESVRKLAEQFSANEKITADDLTAYIGTSEKGPQSVVTYKGDLLILMYSQSKISSNSWGEYISKLK